MNKFSLFLFAVFAFSSISSYATDFGLNISTEKSFKLNPDVNDPSLKFISTAPLEDIEGFVKAYDKIQSEVKLNASNIEKITGNISFPIKTLKTGIKTRDEHLYGSDWLNAVQFPDISFEIKSVSNVKISKKDGDKSEVTATVKGIYSMKGKSKEISVPLKITYIKASEKTAKRAKGDFLSFEGTFDIALKDFDVKGTKDIVGSKVGETIKIEFKLFYNSTN